VGVVKTPPHHVDHDLILTVSVQVAHRCIPGTITLGIFHGDGKILPHRGVGWNREASISLLLFFAHNRMYKPGIGLGGVHPGIEKLGGLSNGLRIQLDGSSAACGTIHIKPKVPGLRSQKPPTHKNIAFTLAYRDYATVQMLHEALCRGSGDKKSHGTKHHQAFKDRMNSHNRSY